MPMNTATQKTANPAGCPIYTISGIRFQVICPEKWMFRDEGVLAAYRSGDSAADHTLEFSLVEQLAPPAGTCICAQPDKQVYQDEACQIRYIGVVGEDLSGAYMRIARCGSTSLVQVKESALQGHITAKLVLNAMEMEHHIVQNGGFLLHASYIGWQGRAILFTAPSGVGKSTQAALWQSLRDAQLFNGDRAGVMVKDGGVYACGIPFSGSSGIAENETLPLSAIVYLSQAPQTRITRLTGINAFRSIWEGCSINLWNKEDVIACTETVLQTAAQIPIFHLACTPDASAVEALEQALTQKR